MRDSEPEASVSAEVQDALTSLLVLVVLAQAGDWQALAGSPPPGAAPAAPTATTVPNTPDAPPAATVKP